MQCVSLAAAGTEGALGLRLQYTFTTASDPAQQKLSPTETNTGCGALNALLTQWMRYAALHGCSTTLLTPTIGMVTCLVVVPRCVVGAHLAWLRTLLAVQQEPIAAAIRQCTLSPTLVLGVPLIHEDDALLIASAANGGGSSSHARPTDAPRLVLPRRKWGQTHLETLDTLLVVGVALLGLIAGCGAACALACARTHRRSVVRRTFAFLGAGRRIHRRPPPTAA
jgi:hypothetical protein